MTIGIGVDIRFIQYQASDDVKPVCRMLLSTAVVLYLVTNLFNGLSHLTYLGARIVLSIMHFIIIIDIRV
jgi:hypothetical protein